MKQLVCDACDGKELIIWVLKLALSGIVGLCCMIAMTVGIGLQ
jgi:hypothetical protein